MAERTVLLDATQAATGPHFSDLTICPALTPGTPRITVAPL